MTDRELLELAAKATGRRWNQELSGDHGLLVSSADGPYLWRPLTEDGDTLRLAVELCMLVDCTEKNIHVFYGIGRIYAEKIPDPYAATRRAIVRAAAEIGKMKGEK